MGTHIHSFRRVLLTTATIAVALTGCVTTDNKMANGGSSAKPVIAAASVEDPMLAAAPPSDGAGNGSRRVPLGQLVANAPGETATAAAPATAGAPMLLVPAGSSQMNADPMDAPPPTTVAAQSPPLAPKAEAPKPAAAQPALPAEKAPAPAAKPALEKPSGPVASTPQPETLQKMAAAAKSTKSTKPEPVPSAQPAPSPPPVVAVASPAPIAEPAAPVTAAKAEAPVPAAKPEPPAPVVAKAEPQPAPAPKMKLNIPPPGTKPPRVLMAEPPDTVVISSASTAPVRETREFIPATLIASAAPTTMSDGAGTMLARPLSAPEKNVAQRFEVLKALLDQSLITPDEYMHHRNSNVGALLPYTHDPAGVGLERPAPSADAVVARLEALRRSLEMRAISTKQHAMERSMILNALLPDSPTDRMPEMPPPEDLIQATTLVSHLQTLRNRSLINGEEFDGERKAIESYLKTGKLPVSASRTDATARAAQAAAARQAEDAKAAAAAKEKKDQDTAMSAEEELTAPVPGPVLHLASFRTKEAANKGWQEAVDRNKALLGSVKEIVRKVDLGQQRGVFYRLMAGPYPSLSAAETACIALKQANQFCRASADGT